MPLRALVAVIVTTVVMLVPRAWADTAWERYKARFMMPDGRIIDTANGNVSHTEGQGFAMLLAVANNDRPAFDKLAPSRRKEHVRSVTEAKAAATRLRRIQKVLDGLS